MTSFNTFLPKNTQSGFTIIELMISTAVFAIILLLAVLMITNSLNEYYKVSIDTSVSSTLQSVVSDVEQNIENSTTLIPGSNYVCTSSEEFIYNLGDEMPTEVASLSIPYALYEFPISSASECQTNPGSNPNLAQAVAAGQSLLGTHYRLMAFNVTPVNALDQQSEWDIDIKIAYTSGGVNGAGDDLLCSPSVTSETTDGYCSPAAPSYTPTDFKTADADASMRCKNEVGEQYCNVENLQGIVGNHIN